MGFYDSDLEQERTEANDGARYDWESMGATDAAFGTLPQYTNAAYLAGYCTQLKELPTDANGRLIHYSSGRHFAWGYVDTQEQSRADDEF